MSLSRSCDLCGVTFADGTPYARLVTPQDWNQAEDYLAKMLRPSSTMLEWAPPSPPMRELDFCRGCTEGVLAAAAWLKQVTR